MMEFDARQPHIPNEQAFRTKTYTHNDDDKLHGFSQLKNENERHHIRFIVRQLEFALPLSFRHAT